MRTNCRRCDCPLMNLVGEKRVVCIQCRNTKWGRARAKQKAKNVPRSRKTERICKDCLKSFPSPDARVLRQCEPCRDAKKASKRKTYYEAHKEEITLKERSLYHADPSIRRERAKQYYEAHREQVLAKKRERLKADVVATTKLGMMR